MEYFRIVHSSSGSNAVIIMEDLAAQLYKQPTQFLGLDETLSAVYVLAKWHATSIFMSKDVSISFFKQNICLYSFIYVNLQHQDLQYSTDIDSKKYNDQFTFLYDNFCYFISDISSWDGFGLYAEKFVALKEVFLVKCRDIFAGKTSGFKVLNHGNLNTKNLLVKDDGQRINVKFVSK